MKKYITKPIDYTGCNSVIAEHLKRGEAIECTVGDRHDTLGAIKVFVVGYRPGHDFSYVAAGNHGAFRFAEPTTVRTELRVKKASELLAKFEADGWRANQYGCWSERHETEPIFMNTMFQYCGEAPDRRFSWLPEWLEEVEITE